MIKRLLFLLAAMFLLMPNLSAQDIWDGSVADSFAGGTGTQDDPYLIEDGAQLAYLAKITNENANQTDGKYYKLVDDIILNENVLNEDFDLNGIPENLWTPIADTYYTEAGFMGDFNGDGHCISGLYIVSTVTGYHEKGLFGSIHGNAVIHDLAVVDSHINGLYASGLISGTLYDSAIITRCYVSGSQIGSGDDHIGLVAGYLYSSSKVEYCYAHGKITGTNYVGGLLGGKNGGSISNSFCAVKMNMGYGVIGDGNYGNENLFYDSTVAPNVSAGNAVGKTTEEMQTKGFAELLGEPFAYADGNYPFIEGLPMVGEQISDMSGYRLYVGELTNGKGSKVKFYRYYDGTDVSKAASRAEAGETVYLQLTIKKNMLLTNNSLIISNDESGQTLALTNVAENIWSFTMPESSITVTVSFHKDPKAPIVWDGSVATSFAGGTGTQDDPYLIADGSQLAYLAKITNDDASQTSGKYYKLTDDIILNEDVLDDNYQLKGRPENEWMPIGDPNNSTGHYTGKGFKGYFDGGGHIVFGMYCVYNGRIIGLFGSIDGEVHDLSVIDSYVSGGRLAGAVGGGINTGARVYNCYAEALVEGAEDGGLIIGHVEGLVDHCYSIGRTQKNENGGGIAGWLNYGNAQNCFTVLYGGNGTIGGEFNRGKETNTFYDKEVDGIKTYGTAKTTEEMQTEEFAKLLGEPFVYAEGNYPYIEGLPKIGEDITFDTSGYRLNLGQLTNRRRSQITFYNEYSADAKSTHRAEAGQTVYLKVTPTNRWLLTDGSLVVVNDANNQSLALTSVAENVFSFTMPEYSVTVSAAFNRDPSVEPVWDGVIASAFDQGKGTEDDPYLIHDGEELAYLAKLCNENCEQTKGKYYKVVEDIYLNEDVLNSEFELRGTPETRWTPIGTESNYFQGVFDGNYHTIHGLYTGSYDDTSLQYGGLFGVTGNATIKNVGLVDSYVDGYYTGAIVAWMGNNGASRVQNCYTSAAVRGSQVSAAIAGYVYGNCVVENCYASGRNFSSYRSTGLICMLYSGAIVRNCFSAVKAQYLITAFTGSTTNLYQDVTNVYGDGNLIPILSASISAGPNLCFKSTSEMQTEKFAKLLGDEFECDGDDYPYIPGLPKVANRDGSGSTGYFLTSGTLTNGRGSRIRYYSTYTDGNAIKGLRRAEAGQKVYVHLNLRRHMLLTEGSLQLTNDLTGQSISLSKEDDLTWSFTMPTADVTVTAALHRDPAMPPVWDGTIAEAFAEGEGTEDDPYLIHDGEELAYLAQLTNANGALTKGKYYKLANDIYLNDQILNEKYEIEEKAENIWTPIGTSNANSFQGNFDGANHTISGVYIPEGGSQPAFFGYISGSVVHNLSLVDTYVKGNYPAALVNQVAYSDSAWVSNCYVEALSEGTTYAGIIVNELYAKGTVEYCYSSGKTINGNSRTSGIVHTQNSGAKVRNCFSAVQGAPAFYQANSVNLVANVYVDQDLGKTFSTREDYCSKHTIEMHTTDFATRMGEPFEYVLGNYPYIPGLQKIGENRGWTTPKDPTHGGAGGTWDGETSIVFASGTGTEDDPYIINNGAQLSYLAKLTNANGSLTKGRYYKLGADIKLNEKVLTDDMELNGTPQNIWEPIGIDNTNCFQGNFDGQNYTISGVYIPEGSYPAFFGYISGSVVRNLSLVDTYVKGNYPAALVNQVAYSDSAWVSNCYVEALSEGTTYAGIIVNDLYAKGTVEYCYSSGKTINSNSRTSSIVHIQNSGGKVRNCFSAVQGAPAFYQLNSANSIANIYSDQDLGKTFSTREDYCSKHTVEMHTTDFATRMGEPFEYVLGNYPYIPGLLKIGENRGWTTPADPTHGGVGGTWDGETSVIFASGTGTEADPYIINNGAQLSYLAKLTNANGNLTKGRFYKLGADIKLNEQVLTDSMTLNGTPSNKWEPIGIDNTNSFQGNFDGQNYTISGVYIPEGFNYPGLFGYANGGRIHNLSLVDTYINGRYAAGLVNALGEKDSTWISRCYVEAFVEGTVYAGVLVDNLYSKGMIEYCYTSGKVAGGSRSAGLVAYTPNAGGKISNCFMAVANNLAEGTGVNYVTNVYGNQDLGLKFSSKTDFCSKQTIEMHSTDFATLMGEPFEYVLGNYPYIPGLLKIGENRGWTTPKDPTHGGAGGTWDGETSVIFASGTGTEDDPYIINNGAQLNYLAKLTNANGELTKGKFYKLGADIKLNEQVLTANLELNGTPTNKWEPIGIDNTNSFQGKFDGQNYTISGVYIPEGFSYAGLFGFINSSEIHDLSLVDTYTKGNSAAGLVNVMAQSDSSKVSHCFVEAVTEGNNYAGTVVSYLYGKGSVDHCYATGKCIGSSYKGGIVTYPNAGCKVKNCYSTVLGAGAIGYMSGNNYANINNVYYDRERSGTTSASTTREDLRSAETTEMLSTDFAARMGEPYEYCVGYYPYIYGLHKISSNGKTSIVNGYSLQLGSLNNGSGCTIEFYRGYKNKTKELSLPVVPGSKVFVDNQTTIYAKVNTGTLKRLSDEGLTVTGNTTGNKIDVSDVDYDLYSFPITNDAVKVAATFLDGSFCGDPEVNNGRDVKWKLNSAKTGLFIEGSGTMVTGLWNTFANTVQTIDVGEGVTNVDAQAFKSMNKAKTVTLPATLQTIGSEAFSGCSATVDLRPCTLLTALHANEFAQFSGIVWLPATVTAIEADAFSGSYANVAHVYSPVADGKALYANGVQVPEKDGWGDIASFGINTNVAVELQWFTGFDLNTITSTDGVIACYSDRALSKVIPNGSKALRGDDQTPIYIKVTPKAAKILFVEGLTVKGKSGNVNVTQEENEVFSFFMPAEAVTVSAQYATGGYCGNTAVNNGHNLIWTLNDGTLAFQQNVMAQGSNMEMGNYASGGTPWQSYSHSVKDIDMGAATSIGDYAFRNCTGVVGMVFGETPMPVGTNAFATQMILIVPAASYSEYQSQWAEYSSNIFRDKETLTMADGQQWRTYYSKVGRMLPSGLKAYTVTGISSSEAEVSQALDYIPAGQAVLIENSARTACTTETVTSLETCLMTTDENNLLQWLTTPKDVTVGEGYTLYKDEFVMVSSGTLPANIAFLPAISSNAARRLTISGSIGEVTDIDNVSTDIEEAEATWYSLDGKKLSGKPTGKGIYLRNGKKVVIK